MIIQNLGVDGPYLIKPVVFKDDRGHFYESFNEKEFKEKIGDINFVQDNESCSSYGVVRGMHFQKPPYEQAKLVRVPKGAVLDVVIDLRKESPTYQQIWSVYLSEENKRQFFVPRGFAHGFLSLKDNTIFQYKCDNFYKKESEGSISWCDEPLPLIWQEYINLEDVIVSNKDAEAPMFNDIDNPF
jgi:dTDP-4-dehydrorhamnose 3,5-epimerase